ncbi:outer membrane insertion C-terminal signal [Bradyrhizobium lablabi]|uniref:Outer membrane insertion C-terminal signal n=1 Tax=Bradyrhizobium lablabi TaxID=722472 RepID=A0A1M6Z2C0_9BRAD|nr:outer membrane beta-barrel protein [Bradyrhizobium lablabi]SHL24522.1 outer membrane insertion C-terminal signal [Bradyrhizobium lablabi]
MRRLLLAAVMFGAVSGAQAADMPDLPILRGAYTDGLSSPRVSWQGFYAGVQGGFGTSDMNFTGATSSVASHLLANTAIEASGGVSQWPVGGKVSVHGNGFGGFAGYNSLWDEIVLGVEFSYLHGKFGGTQTDSMGRIFKDANGTTDSVTYESIAAMRISDMATLRGRAGYAVGSFLPYAFGGVALGQADIIRTAHIFGTQFNANNPIGFQNIPFDLIATDSKNSHFIYGYTAGLGVDVQLISCLFLRAEWEYVRFTSSIDTNVNTVRVGLGYKF